MDSINSSSYTSSFKVGGLVSGLKTDDIVSQLLEIEKKPLLRIENKKSVVTQRLTAWQELNTRIYALQTQALPLERASTFQARNVFSSDTNILTATAVAGTNNANQTVTVKALAQVHEMASGSYNSTTAKVDHGTLKFTIGSNTHSVTIDSSNDTLAKLRDTINNGNYGVNANIAKVGTDSFRLILTSKTNGQAGEVTVDAGTTGLAFDTIQAAQDAHILLGSAVGGGTPIEIFSPSNTITGVIDGVTLNLTKADPDKPVTINLRYDQMKSREALEKFIEQFNNLVDYFDNQFFFDTESKKTGTLFSSTDLMQVKNRLYSVIDGRAGAGGDYNYLRDIGIGINTAGKLAIQDESALTEALSQKQDEVISFFTDKDNGLGVKINNFIRDITDSTIGILKTAENSFNEEIKILNDQITAKNQYIQRAEQRHYAKFSQLESTMAKLQSQGNYLSMQISSMLFGASNTNQQ